ncbi:MAG: tetratricopeptide repeat protein [Rickettsiales bacterium]|nr:tetratricopeptide repeat protein [Rickettsiales bacterium]
MAPSASGAAAPVYTLFQQALSRHQAGALDEASALYRQVLAHLPSHTETLYNLANIFSRQDNVPQAIAMLRRILDVQPDHAGVHNNLGLLLEKQGALAEAEHHFHEAVTHAPELALAHYNLGRILHQKNDFSGASRAYQQAIIQRQDVPEFYFNLALAQENDGTPLEAIETLRTLLKYHPAYHRAVDRLISLAKQHGRGDVLLEILPPIFTHQPARTAWVMALAEQLDAAGRYTDSAALLEQAHRQMPEDSAVLLMLARAVRRLGDAAAAMTYLQKAHALAPDNLDVGFAMHKYHARDPQNPAYDPEILARCFRTIIAQAGDAQGVETLKVHLAALEGETPVSLAEAYVTEQFDAYAEHFESQLVETLHYAAPEEIHDILAPLLPETPLRILDLGCGTGLSGAVFAKRKAHLVGVDLSPKMLAKAQEKQLYDTLITADIRTAMRQQQNADFDLVIAADVFIYVGALEEVFAEVTRILKPGGWFAFSVEIPEVSESIDQGFVLRHSGRYAHNATYIEACAVPHQLVLSTRKKFILRKEDTKEIPGEIFALQKPR